MKPTSFLCATAIVLTPLIGFSQAVISINIAGGNENAPGAGGAAGEGIVTGTAGIGQLGNWNNAIGTSGTESNLLNSDGDATNASFSWVTNNTWSTSSANGAGNDEDMMSGYLDNFHANGSITVESLGPEFTTTGYDVLVYYQNDNNANTAGFTGDDNLGNTDTRFGHQITANNNWPLAGGVDGYVVSEETDSGTTFSANVVRLSGLMGSDFTLTGVAGTGQPSIRARPNAVQIVALADATDTDGDGLPDVWETENGLDPNDNGDTNPDNGADGDPDGDGLSNADELARGTDPQDADSDDDGLGDAAEDNTGTYVSPTQTGSNPNNPDTDGDGLNDGAEVEENPFFSDPNNPDTDGDGLDDASEQEENPFITDPNNEDTDGDGFSDLAEINLGSDPTDENSVPGLAGGTVISINIAGGNQNAPGTGGGTGEGIVTGAAGIGQLENWNNAIGTSGTIPNLDNSDGNPSGASFSWVTNNTWSTSSADGAGGDADMMSGYLDNFHANGSITVEGLGSEFTSTGYDVLVYYQNDNNANTAGFTLEDSEGNTDTRFGHQITANNNWPLAGGIDGYLVSAETDSSTSFSANVVKLSGFTGADFTITGNAGTGQPSIRARPNAIQIITEGVATDSDGDGLPDGWETDNGLDPNDNGDTDPDNGADGDPDGDGLSNLEEFEGATDPQNADSDGDGLSDGDEVNVHGSDPRNGDSDGDGLSDGDEVNVYGTNPAEADTDGDGKDDGTEVTAGTDPNDPLSVPEAFPIAYWSFDDLGEGGTTADLSGGGNDGTVNGDPEFVPGPSGDPSDFAIQFDGVDDSVTTGVSLLNGLEEFTMAGWVKWDVIQPGNRIGWFGQNDAVEFGQINPTTMHHWANVGGAFDTPVPETSDWLHIAVVGDSTGRRSYLDGVLQPGQGASIVGSSSGGSFNIGGSGVFDAAGNWFTGFIDEVAVWDVVLSDEQILALATHETTPIGPRGGAGDPLGLDVQEVNGELEVSWNSENGDLYDLLSNLDLQTERASWGVWDGNEMMEATPPRNTLTIPFPGEAQRFFAVRAYPAPPEAVFSDDFEGGQGDWTIGSDGADGTVWELGVPTVTGPPAASSPVNCFATNLAGDYGIDANVWLRSPTIDLTAASGATLNFAQYIDIEVGFDFGTVSVLDAADDSVIAVLIDVVDGIAVDWEQVSEKLPAAALDGPIKIEWRFTSDNLENFPGWYVDDVLVTVP